MANNLVRDPVTGAYTFRDPTTAVISNVTGQTASSAQAISNVGTAVGATTPVQQANVATYFTPQATLKDTAVTPVPTSPYTGTSSGTVPVTPPPPPPPAPTPTLSSTSLAPTPTQNFQSPVPSPYYPVSTLAEPEFGLSGSQQGAQDLNTQLQQLNNEMIGRSAYQTEQENLAGIPGYESTLRDLGAQLTGIKNEAAAIPLQLMQGASERGVTTPVLGAQENSRLRTNAIAALGVSTLLSAAQGQLANAQSMADRAVAQKYDPIEEKISAGMNNLQLIMNSPQYSQDEKKQAFQQQQYLQAQAEQVAQAKQEDRDIWSIATGAASNIQSFNPNNGQYQTAAQALQAIQNAPTKEEALNIATQSGFASSAKGSSGIASIQEYEYAKSQGYTGSFMDYKGGGSSGGSSELLSVSEAKSLGVPYGTTVGQAASMGITPSDTSGTANVEKDTIHQELLASRNAGPEADGVYADPNLYTRLRAQSDMAPSTFDSRYSYLINPASRSRLGLGSTTTSADLDTEQLAVINEAKAVIDQARQLYKNVPEIRQQIIDRVLQEDGFDMSPYI